jgi:hypothetical protein
LSYYKGNVQEGIEEKYQFTELIFF